MAVSNERPPTGYMGDPATNKRMGLVRLATAAEAAAGTANNIAVTPAQIAASIAASFASPPVLGFGSTTPRPVHATTLDSSGLTSLATGAGAVTNIGNATGTIGFFGVAAAARPTSTTDIKDGLALMGLLTNGGASPLNLDGGALGAGASTLGATTTTTLGSTGNTAIASGAGAVADIGNATGTIGFFGVTAAARPGATADIKDGLALMGLLTNGGATPLDLDGGALGAGASTLGATTSTTLGSTGNTSLATGAGATAAMGNATGTVGFFGSAGATVVTQGALTNSVTSGGVAGTIANFTDLTVYANDAATIRDDIYQLSLALSTVVSALRSYGLLA